MNKLKFVVCTAFAGLLLAAGPGFAQVSAKGMGKVLPVEIYACSYKDGKGSADLDKVVERWNKYADDRDTNDYAAWLLTPFFFGTEQDFDVLWLGAYKDGHAMGKGLQDWISNGGELNAAFGEVVDCNAHVAYSSAMYKAPPSGTPASGIITMMNCELNEGHKYADIKAAELKWADHLVKTKSKAAYYHWMPMFGGGDAGFDYKVIFSYSDFGEIGSQFEAIANGGGRELSREIFGDIDECDDARVYVAKSIRAAKIRD
ncbi:MAG TPA: hypothetical protein PKK10_04030 [Woeseiaceae bacterium]|nr:hypothetical protein [Woeseiaceae bacterium]